MLNRRRILAALLAGTMAVSLAACGGGGSKDVSTASGSSSEEFVTSNEQAAEGTLELTEWEKSSNIFKTDETEDELYELAKKEGKVTVYSISSRITKVAKAFEEKYPGITVEPFDISTNELLEKVSREYDADQHVADAIHIKDEDGTLLNEYVMKRKFYNYQPEAIMKHIEEQYKKTATPLYIEQIELFYNAEANPDGPPLTNIWELTDPKWKGRIMMQNPLDNLSWGSWITSFCVGEVPEQLEKAYKELYGKDLELSEGSENAGYELLKRIHDNKPIYTSSGEEIAESVGTKGQANPPIGFSSSSKLRKNKDNDWALAPINLYPTVGMPAVNTVYVVGECKHPNAAKLFLRFMMGGDDGTSAGYKEFNTLGGWPVRDDIQPVEGSMPLSELNTAAYKPTEIYNHINSVRDFWTLLE